MGCYGLDKLSPLNSYVLQDLKGHMFSCSLIGDANRSGERIFTLHPHSLRLYPGSTLFWEDYSFG